jgi:hypothetical protein
MGAGPAWTDVVKTVAGALAICSTIALCPDWTEATPVRWASTAQPAPATWTTDDSLHKPRISPGTLIRITLRPPPRDPLVGKYENAAGDSLSIESIDSRRGRESWRMAIRDIARVETSRKRSSKALEGVLVGTLLGGAALGAALSRDSESPPLGALLYPPIGALVGALVGGGIVSYDWKVVWEQPTEAARPGR